MRRTALPHSGRREAAALMSCVGKYYNPIINGKAGGPFSLHWSLGSVPVFPHVVICYFCLSSDGHGGKGAE